MKGKTILITGSTDGVGRHVAERLAAEGALAIVHGRDRARGEALAARIVNVASAGQQAIDFSDVMLTRDYSGVRAYRQSKLAQIMFTFDLAEELAGRDISVTSLHPATYMNTTMVRLSGVQPISTVEEGGAAILQLVRSSELAGKSGLYFDGMRLSRANAQAYDPAARRRLRKLSFALVGLADPMAV